MGLLNGTISIRPEKHDFFRNRHTFYSAFPIREQIIRKNPGSEFGDIFMVGILDFLFRDSYRNELPVSETEMYDDRKLTFVCLHLPNFSKTEDELETHFEEWIYHQKYYKMQGMSAEASESDF